jgi:hypothetical protein
VLENWTVAHALREVIANALDKQALTGTAEPQIFQDAEDRWHIRDWGRRLRYEHLTQSENKEKLTYPDKVVGKFGVGLKDALATFDRHRVAVVIRSRYGDITTGKQAKAGIYVNGLRVAEEDNFLFSYNITSPTVALRRA